MIEQSRIQPTLSIGHNIFALAAAESDTSDMTVDRDQIRELIARNLQGLLDERKDLNASAWAKAAGMGHTGVRDIITGKVQNPTYFTLVKLADIAGVDVQRITVGPESRAIDPEIAEHIDLLAQLSPEERRFLRNAAKAQIADRDRSGE